MNDLIPFEYADRVVNTVLIDGEPWFLARDVAEVLDLNSTPGAVRLLDEDEKGMHIVHTPGGDQRMSIISESGLYSLILRSRKPEARKFRRWVTHEVLPAVRETGRYEVAASLALPKSYAEALRELATTVEERDTAQAKVIELHPKAEAWDTLADTGADYSAREAAYILNRDPAISTGQNRLLALLRSWGLIDSGGTPYANHSTHVTLKPQTRWDKRAQKRVPADPQVRVTVAGLQYLHNRMGGVSPLDFSEVAS